MNRHNKKTMNACAIDRTKLDAVIPDVLVDLVWHKVECLREAYISLGGTCISKNPTFILVDKQRGAVMHVTSDNRGIPSESLKLAQKFSVSEQDDIIKQAGSFWTPMSKNGAAEFMLEKLTKDVWWYVDTIIESDMTQLADVRQIQSGEYFGWEMPELLTA